MRQKFLDLVAQSDMKVWKMARAGGVNSVFIYFNVLTSVRKKYMYTLEELEEATKI